MIKQLIKDLALDDITLSKALTKMKIIQNKVKNETLKNWLIKELSGYDFDDKFLPDYRRVYSEINLVAHFPGGKELQCPIKLPDDAEEQGIEYLKFHKIQESISVIEIQLSRNDTRKSYINLTSKLIDSLSLLLERPLIMQIKLNSAVLQGFREIDNIVYHNVIEQTKQKLLDTLIELDNEFPDLEDDFKSSNENSNKLQNIVTNNIYGGTNPMNIALGENVTQSGNTINLIDQKTDELRSYGVEENEIKELKEIIKQNSNDKPKLSKNLLGWLGKVTTSISAKGLYENIPQITEFVKDLIL
jgi:hypothetical protein